MLAFASRSAAITLALTSVVAAQFGNPQDYDRYNISRIDRSHWQTYGDSQAGGDVWVGATVGAEWAAISGHPGPAARIWADAGATGQIQIFQNTFRIANARFHADANTGQFAGSHFLWGPNANANGSVTVLGQTVWTLPSYSVNWQSTLTYAPSPYTGSFVLNTPPVAASLVVGVIPVTVTASAGVGANFSVGPQLAVSLGSGSASASMNGTAATFAQGTASVIAGIPNVVNLSLKADLEFARLEAGLAGGMRLSLARGSLTPFGSLTGTFKTVKLSLSVCGQLIVQYCKEFFGTRQPSWTRQAAF